MQSFANPETVEVYVGAKSNAAKTCFLVRAHYRFLGSDLAYTLEAPALSYRQSGIGPSPKALDRALKNLFDVHNPSSVVLEGFVTSGDQVLPDTLPFDSPTLTQIW
jgi:hypothetical protein